MAEDKVQAERQAATDAAVRRLADVARSIRAQLGSGPKTEAEKKAAVAELHRISEQIIALQVGE